MTQSALRYVCSNYPPVPLGPNRPGSPIAVVLAGCGQKDGSEITEAVSLLVALSQAGIAPTLFAPNRPQHHVINHSKGEEEVGQPRNILAEANRIGRGVVLPLDTLNAQAFQAVILPGGFGAAKNLCNYAFMGPDASLMDDVALTLTPFLKAKKPIGALCIAPVILALLAKTQGLSGATITLGSDGPDARNVERWGAHHVAVPNGTAVVDETFRFVTAPAYMYGQATPAQVFACAQALVAGVQQLLG